jgi:tetraacyldisaccharide 4'-kinase
VGPRTAHTAGGKIDPASRSVGLDLIDRLWYASGLWVWPLLPLSGLFCLAAAMRRRAYRRGWLRRVGFEVPVLVVGNIVVGGAGKTPLVAWLARFVAQAGWRLGIVSRGYGGSSTKWPRDVGPDSDPAEVGDEPVLLARLGPYPVVAAPDRAAAVRCLLGRYGCNVVICDDGLQHYRMERDLELVVLDGLRRLGNGHCLPAGPLREPPSRLREVGVVRICNGGMPGPGELGMRLQPAAAWNLAAPKQRRSLSSFAGEHVHAVAAIGHPERFFAMLEGAGVRICRHPYPDHHPFRASDLEFGDSFPVLMTEKDAVKCTRFASSRHWAVPIEAVPDAALGSIVLECLSARHGPKT